MILVLGGTSDSLRICEALNKLNLEYMVSVTTDYGKQLSLKVTNNILEGKMDQQQMTEMIKEKDIRLMIDSTHPYAIEVSKNGMLTAQALNIPYVRYERPSLLEEVEDENLYVVKDTAEACALAAKIGQNIFLGTGSKTLGEFVRALPDKKIIARVLPTSEVIQECEALGLNPDHIIGMKGPFSEEMNALLYKEYAIDCMITKESGHEGGFLEKIRPCKILGIKTIVIKRAGLAYPCVYHEIKELVAYVETLR